MVLLAEAYIGKENPRGDVDPLYSEESDRLFMVDAKSFHIGHVRVFDHARTAELWFAAMRDRSNVWACWRMGFPLGPFAEDQMYREADGAVQMMATFIIDAQEQFDAAGDALTQLRQTPEAAVKIYASDDV